MKAAGKNRWGHRDATMILIAYRHGLRASELVDLRWDQIDFNRATLAVRRVKRAPLQRIRSAATSCGRCAGCSASRNPRSAFVFTQRARRALQHSRICQARGARRRGRRSSASRRTRTCSGTPAASRWRTRGTIPGRCSVSRA